MEDFTPLLEEEQRRLKKQRERNDKISKLMGNYLLKGYKMLGTTCNKCQAILLRDRQGEDYCVGCVEVDAPQQQSRYQTSKAASSPATAALSKPGQMEVDNGLKQSTLYTNGIVNGGGDDREKQIAHRSIQCIYDQISWANYRFGCVEGVGIGERNQLVNFLKNCYEAIDLLKKHQ